MGIIPKCMNCSKELQIEQYFDCEVRKRLTSEYDEIEYKLNDGSKMRVPICKTCKNKTISTEKIMSNVKKFWEREIERLNPVKPKNPVKYKHLEIIGLASEHNPTKKINPIKKEN